MFKFAEKTPVKKAANNGQQRPTDLEFHPGRTARSSSVLDIPQHDLPEAIQSIRGDGTDASYTGTVKVVRRNRPSVAARPYSHSYAGDQTLPFSAVSNPILSDPVLPDMSSKPPAEDVKVTTRDGKCMYRWYYPYRGWQGI